MEAELIAMTSNLFHGDINNPYGVTTSGGTESICMAVLAARNYCERYKGITEPELSFFFFFFPYYSIILFYE